ncbi:MAG: NAD-dependent dehydratase [Actinomycetia bacterium]|nr:NAD-dependent dehydratase [Actinomycetes bacterium]
MRVLVSGAGGFIGAHLVRDLLGRGHEVHALARRPGRVAPAGVASSVALDRASLAALAPDAAVHLAWVTEPGAYLEAVEANEVALATSAELVDALVAAGCGRLVVAGTCLEDQPGTAGGDSPYARAKRDQHRLAVEAGLSSACAHIFSVYGPGEDERRAVSSVVLGLLGGDRVAVSPGDQVRDYLHVADVAGALATLAEHDVEGGIDVGSGDGVELAAVFAEIGRLLDASDRIDWGARTAAAVEQFSAVADPSALHQLGWRPRYSLVEGLADTITWWKQSRSSNRKARA